MKNKAFVLADAKMETHHDLRAWEAEFLDEVIGGFVPDEVFDFHTHLFRDSDFSDSNRPQFSYPGLGSQKGQANYTISRSWRRNFTMKSMKGKTEELARIQT